MEPKKKFAGRMMSKPEFMTKYYKRYKISFLNYCWKNNTAPAFLMVEYQAVKKIWKQSLTPGQKVCVRCRMILQTTTPNKPNYLTVDHIRPQRTNPCLMLSINNFQPMCKRCNGQKG